MPDIARKLRTAVNPTFRAFKNDLIFLPAGCLPRLPNSRAKPFRSLFFSKPPKSMNAQGKFRAVCFDCDSTLSRLEGIDELASRYGHKSEVALLTDAAMNGELSIDDVYAKRLSIVRPDREAVAWLGERYVQELVPGAKETIEVLHRLGKEVYVVSGGLLPSVGYLARALAIPESHVYAVQIQFDESGAYQGFDEGSPLPRADGKAIVCRQIAARHGATAMVGDGMTDVAARAGGAFIIGFGGVAYRETVAMGADCYVTAAELTATLAPLLSEDERKTLTLA
jgi:phosphoserine phosphatase